MHSLKPGQQWREHPVVGQYWLMTMAGAARNGGERGGGCVRHVVVAEHRDALPQIDTALCGKTPAMTWSTWAPDTLRTCPRCERKLAAAS